MSNENIYYQTILLATQNKYDQLEPILKEQSQLRNLDLHDTIARIAIKSQDAKLFSMTNHHPRILLEEFASNNDSFPFLLEQYKDNYFIGRDVPSYVWTACTVQNLKLLIAVSDQMPHLGDISGEAFKVVCGEYKKQGTFDELIEDYVWSSCKPDDAWFLAEISNQNPLALLSNDDNLFNFFVDKYKESGYFQNHTISDEVWIYCTLDQMKILIESSGQRPSPTVMSVLETNVQEYFGYSVEMLDDI